MQLRSPIGRVILGLTLALSLAMGGVAAIAATAANDPGGATLAAPISAVHTSGMRHGQGSSDDALAQVLCLIACMGLTAAPSLPAPDAAYVPPSFVVQLHITGRDAGDQVLNRPTSPPPRGFATI